MQIFWHTNNGLEEGKLMPKSEKKIEINDHGTCGFIIVNK